MEIPIAVAVGADLVEVYELKQKQDELFAAEEDLALVLSLSNDFFATTEERDATYADIQANPSAVYEKPFMKKIAAAFSNLKRCKDAVEWASESVVDTSLTPAQVKAQIKQLIRHTQEAFAKRMEERLLEVNTRTDRLVEDLKQQLETETRHRKAFQAKFKNFYEEQMLDKYYDSIGGYQPNGYQNELISSAVHKIRQLAFEATGLIRPTDQDRLGTGKFFVFERAGVPSGNEDWIARKTAHEQFKPTYFDGTDP
jgi:hypothetical protein